MKSYDLVRLLAQRHSKDVFVPECKDGPTTVGRHQLRRLDAWAMRRSWSPITTYGYEIKVTRGDWLRDQKLEEYLPCVHLFSVVTPPGLVRPTELPEGVGLVEAVGRPPGSRLVTRKMPARNDAPDPHRMISLYAYVLMSRSTISRASERTEDRAAYWRRWLVERRDARDLGYSVSKKVRQMVDAANTRATAAERERESVNDAVRQLRELGVLGADEKPSHWTLHQRIREIYGNPAGHLDALDATITKLTAARDQIARLMASGGDRP